MASAVIGALRVNLGIDTAQFSEGLSSVRASMAKAGRDMQAWGGKLSTYVTAPISVAGAAVTAAVITMARDVEQLEKSAQISNTTFEQFQRLAFAARTVGVESEKLSDIYKDVNDRVGDFMSTGGGPMADFFENIAPKVGVTADQFARLSGPEALQLYYDSLVKAGASQQEMTFYLEAMASDTTALIPLLREGGAAFKELGEGAAVLTAEDAASLKQYNDAMRLLGESIRALTIALVNTGVIETLTGIVQKVTEWTMVLSKTNPEIIKWTAVVAGIAAAVGPAAIAIGLLVTALAAVSAPVLAFAAGIAAGTAAAVAFWPEIVKMKDAIVNFMSGDVLAKITDIGKQIVQGIVNGIKAAPGAVRDALLNVVSGAWNAAKDFLGIRSPSRLFQEMGGYVVEGLGQGMQSMSGQVEGIASNIASTVSQAFQGLIDGSKTVKDVIKDLLSQLSTMWINQGFQALLGGGMGGGGGGGIFGGLFSGIGKLFGGFFADGGRLGAGKWGIAGEFGPEIIKGPANVVPMSEMVKSGEGGGGKSVNIHQTFQLSGAVSSDDVQTMVRQGAGQAVQYVKESLPDWQFQQQTFGKIA
ncbi:hypothetical protein GCM10007908_03740 [Rhizobium albus]|nr:hypothetical protein GCM10007908_03740 [Rhizobium albus]